MLLQAMFGDRRLLLDFPDFVANTWLNLASATWFLTTPQPPKPSMLHVIDGTWIPNRSEYEHKNILTYTTKKFFLVIAFCT
jgi:hypothetical protein